MDVESTLQSSRQENDVILTSRAGGSASQVIFVHVHVQQRMRTLCANDVHVHVPHYVIYCWSLGS